MKTLSRRHYVSHQGILPPRETLLQKPYVSYQCFSVVHLGKYCYRNIILPINVSVFFHLRKHCCRNIMFPHNVSQFCHLGKHCRGNITFSINVPLFVHLEKHCRGNNVAETKFASQEAKIFLDKFKNILVAESKTPLIQYRIRIFILITFSV